MGNVAAAPEKRLRQPKAETYMTIGKTLRVLEELEEEGIVDRYAIGGGMATIVYIEPFLTYDLDVFVLLPPTHGRLVSIRPIYDYLSEKGFKPEGEHVLVGDVPAQFIPAYNNLTQEAVKEAIIVESGGLRMRVFRLEHLVAIMLQTDRPKDRARLVQVLDQAKLDKHYLTSILRRHRLLKRWARFRKRFYGRP